MARPKNTKVEDAVVNTVVENENKDVAASKCDCNDKGLSEAEALTKAVENATLVLANILLQSAEENANEIYAKLANSKWWNVRRLKAKAQKAELIKLQAAGIVYYAEKMANKQK